MTVYYFECVGEPKVFNATSKASFWSMANEVKLWRELFAWEAKQKRPRVRLDKPVTVTVIHLRPIMASRKVDAGAVYVAAKGAIDGLVDAGVLSDDGPDIVRNLVFVAPEVRGFHGLRIEVKPW